MNSLWIALAMYSRIPVPIVDWDEKSMKYALCFFPVIGILIAAAEICVFYLCERLCIGLILRSALLCVVPIFITGGIHVDGFLDTVDALSSHADREKKLEILKDSHTGAFAILGGVIYFLLSVAVWSEVTEEILFSIVAVFMLSRSLSGLAAVTFPAAKKTGLLFSFTGVAHKRVVRICLGSMMVLSVVWMIGACPPVGICGTLMAALIFGYYRYFSWKEFGGITGDLAGYFLQICELIVPFAMILAERIFNG